MVDVKNITDISLSYNETCFLVGWQYFNNSYFRLKIPKLMPSVTPSRVEPFNRNILVNAPDCKPLIGNTISVQNFVTIKRSPQCSLFDRIANDNNEVPDGTGVTCLCLNNNYKDITIIDSL